MDEAMVLRGAVYGGRGRGRLPRVCLLLVPALLWVAGAASGLETAEEIDDCQKGNLPDTTSVQTVSLRAKDRIGAVNETRADLYWRRFDDDKSKALMLFSAPPDMEGAGLLIVQKPERNDMFMYLPELRKVRRVSGHMMSGSMFGTDFTYEQFERMQGMADDAELRRDPDSSIGGRAVYVLASVPKPGSGSKTDKVITHVDQETCVGLRVEYFEGDRVRRVLEVDPDRIDHQGEVYFPRYAVMKDLRDETETVLEIEKLELGGRISNSMFTQGRLERGH